MQHRFDRLLGVWFVLALLFLSLGPAAAADIILIPVSSQRVVVNPLTQKLYAASLDVVVVDTLTNAIVNTIVLGDGMSTSIGTLAINPFTQRLYGVDNKSPSHVIVIDTSTDTPLTTIATAGVAYAIAVNTASNRVYIGYLDRHELAVIDGNTNTITQTLPLGNKTPNEIAVNPVTNRLYVSYATFDGTYEGPPYGLLVLDADTLAVLHALPTESAANRISVNEFTNQVYLSVNTPEMFEGNVLQVDGATHTAVAAIPLAEGLNGVTANPFNDRIYVATNNLEQGSGKVYILDAISRAIVDVKPIGTSAYDTAFDPVTNQVYVVADYPDASGGQQFRASAAGGGDTIAVFRYLPPPLVAPKRNVFSTNKPTLSWTPVTWAVGYRVEVDNNTSFLSPEFVWDKPADPSAFVTTEHLDNGRYHWRVRAWRANGGRGGWSAVDSFTVNVP